MSDAPAPEIALEADRDLAAAARKFAGDSIAVFAHAVRNSSDERIRFSAAKTLLELGFGNLAAQAEPPSPDAAQSPDDPISTAEFWADFTDSDLLLHFLDAVREVRGRGLVCGAQRYAATLGIRPIEMREEGGQYVDRPPYWRELSPGHFVIDRPDAEVTDQPDAEVTDQQLDLSFEVEPSIERVPDPATPTTTPRSLTPGPARC